MVPRPTDSCGSLVWVPFGDDSSDHPLLQAQTSSCLLAAMPKHPCTNPSLAFGPLAEHKKTNGWKGPRVTRLQCRGFIQVPERLDTYLFWVISVF